MLQATFGASPYQNNTTYPSGENAPQPRLPDAPAYSKETFMEAAQRLTLLARLGVDVDTLNKIESEIEDLEALDSLTEEQQTKLDSLYEQRDDLFKQAMERQSGKSLPPGSMLSFSV